MKTTWLKPKELKENWMSIDAKDQVLGRLAVKISTALMGKDRPDYTPGVLGQNFVVVTNCEKVKLTGNKLNDKTYYHHTGWRRGGLKQVTAGELMAKKPTEVIRLAVKRMLPSNKLRKRYMNRLKLFVGAEHNHQAQKPETAN